MDIATITASVAGVCMAICQIPQAWSVYRTNNTEGISIGMQVILSLGIAMWFVTGILLNNPPMYLSNGFCLVFCLYVVCMCLRNRIRKNASTC